MNTLVAGAAAAPWRAHQGEFVGFDRSSGLWIVKGAGVVGQACSDPTTFAGFPVELALAADAPAWREALSRSPLRVPAVPVNRQALALLRTVWPATVAQAGLTWGCSISAHADRAAAALAGIARDPADWPARGGVPVQRLAEAVVCSAFGICGGTIRLVRGLRDQLAPRVAATPAAQAGLPLAALREVVDHIVRQHVTEPADALDPGRPDAVVDDLLAFRGLGPERTPLGDVTALCCALFAAAWDATAALLARLVDTVRAESGATAALAGLGADVAHRNVLVAAAVPPLPSAAGWLRRTTQPVLLHGVTIPAGASCLLLVDPMPGGDVQPAAVAAVRWLAPAAANGAGMTLARLAGHRLLAALARHVGNVDKPAPATGRPGRRPSVAASHPSPLD
ncbi:hypothetical protein [Dactylosporangium sp. CA-139066]|uniref:hypothetical protein n=1 Tax=Dactylosporangium sp. CA-139066 TaxID=3239930 RepID=UPI003D8C2156